MAIAYIGLGSNLNHPQQQVGLGLTNIAKLSMVTVLQTSAFYLTEALLHTEQPDFVNAVVKVTTALSPNELMQQLLKIEVQQGRVRDGIRWGPRIIDLDLLLYDNEIVDTHFLRLPHPSICERAFVLVPLLEIEPNLCLPAGESLQKYHHAVLKTQAIKKLTEPQFEDFKA